MENKVSVYSVTNFLADFYAGKFPNLRLGQAFLNTFYPDIIHPELMEERENAKSIEIIYNTYVNFVYNFTQGIVYERKE
jgi:hypothetical protein